MKDKAVQQAESGKNASGTRTSPREDHGATSGPKQLVQGEINITSTPEQGASIAVVTDTSQDSWGNFVVHFQDQMQRYRNLVRDLSEGDCNEDDVQKFEGEVRSLGSRLVSVWQESNAKDIVKSRAKQLLSYVAAYCETHDRPQMNGEFLVLLAQCVEGALFFES